MRRLPILVICCALNLICADLTGIWIGRMPARNGEFQDIAFKYTQDEATLGGKLYGDYQSTAITEGKITGDQISFLVIAPEQNGNQINRTRLRFTGVIKDGEIELTREREGSTNAGNGGDVLFKSNSEEDLLLQQLV